MFRIKGQSGFTIVEAVIGITIFLVAMVGVTLIFTSGGQSIQMAVGGSQANQLASQKLTEITRLPFYEPWTGTDQDIDDYYYDEDVDNPGQLTNPNPIWAEGYGTIADYPKCRWEVVVQYQELATGAPPDTGQLLGAVPEMRLTPLPFMPRTAGQDIPENAGGEELNLIKVQVTVYYKNSSGGESSVVVSDLVNNNVVESGVGPKVYSVSPEGFTVGGSFTFTVYGNDFSNEAEESPDLVRIWKAGATEHEQGADINSWSNTMVNCTVTVSKAHVSPDDTYWNITVVDPGIKAGSLENCLYEVIDEPFIAALDPESGAVGDWVDISGYDFGTKDGSDYVSFNGVTVTSYGDWNNSLIEVQVPVGATTGPVVVHKALTGDSNGVIFSTGGPYLASIINIESGRVGDASGDTGDMVRLEGTGFGGAGVVRFQPLGVNATAYVIRFDTLITCQVPAGAVSGTSVLVINGVSSNSVSFVIPYEEGH